MQSEQDYYKVLDIAPGASINEIKSAYRKLAFQYHPDRNHASQESNNTMQQINEAYATLSDPIKRKDYDITHGYSILVPKFKKGNKVRVNFNSISPYRDHTGVIYEEPIKDKFRFWYMVKFGSKGFFSDNRFAEEELEQVSE